MLADIELAQTLQAAPEETKKVEAVPHPLDRDYQLLKCQLQLLDPEAPEYKVGLGLLSLYFQGLRSALGLRGEGEPVGVLPQGSCPWHPPSALPAGDIHLLRTDWQQLQVPGCPTCLEREPRRGGEGESPPSPCPIMTLSHRLISSLVSWLNNSDQFPPGLCLVHVCMSVSGQRALGLGCTL